MSDDDRMLPVSVEAEMGAIGAMLLDPMLVPVAFKKFDMGEDCFYVPAHRLIFGAMMRMEADGRLEYMEILTLGEELRTMGKLERIGGSVYLDKCVHECMTAAHGEYYLDVVRKKYELRGVVSCLTGFLGDAYRSDDPGELISRASGELLKLEAGESNDESNADAGRRIAKKYVAVGEGGKPAIGLELPWESMTEILCGLEPGLTILAGRPSAGKTTVEDMICTGLAAKGIAVGRVTLDGSRDELLTRAACRKAGVSLPKLKFGYAGKSQVAEFEDAMGILGEYPMYFDDETRDLRGICSRGRAWKMKYDIGLLTVDFLQIVQVLDPAVRGMSRVDLVGYVSGTLKALSFELGIPVLALSQLNRGVEKEDREPRMSDVRDSGSIEQDAHKMVFVYKDVGACRDMEGAKDGSTRKVRPSWMSVVKNKDGEIGKVGFLFRAPYFLFEEVTESFDALMIAGRI